MSLLFSAKKNYLGGHSFMNQNGVGRPKLFPKTAEVSRCLKEEVEWVKSNIC